MPGRDGTGPLGQGQVTGRGQGNCYTKPAGYGRGPGPGLGYGCGPGLGYGRGRGNGRCLPMLESPVDSMAQQERLKAQKAILEARIEQINKQIGDQDNK